MKQGRTDYQNATATLKLALKRQKITYRELAQGIGLSESGLKKTLSAKDGSFQRLVKICRYAGISMQDLLDGASEGMRDVTYTDKQQTLLLENQRTFRLYWALAYERRPLAEAEKVAGLSAKESFNALRKLDQAQLLKLLPGGRLRLPPVQPIRWIRKGALIEKLYREWSQKLIQETVSSEPSLGESLFLIRYWKVTPRTFRDFQDAIRNLEAEFVRRATLEMRQDSANLQHLRMVVAMDNRSFLNGL